MSVLQIICLTDPENSLNLWFERQGLTSKSWITCSQYIYEIKKNTFECRSTKVQLFDKEPIRSPGHRSGFA
jgi:hypothetical protein